MTLARNATGIEARIRDDALGHSERSLVLAVAHGAVVAQADNATETRFGRGVQIFDRYGSRFSQFSITPYDTPAITPNQLSEVTLPEKVIEQSSSTMMS